MAAEDVSEVSAPVQLAPLLSLYADEGDFTLRLDGSPLAQKVGPEIIRLLSGNGGRRLTILTPTDTKIFKLNGATHASFPSAPAPSATSPIDSEVEDSSIPEPTDQTHPRPRVPAKTRIQQDMSAPPSPELAEEEAEEIQRIRAEEREAERLRKEMEAANRADPNLPPLPTEEEEEAAQAPRVRRRASRPEPSTAAETPCGRCFGAGQLDGGGACPVCHGKGSHQLYGRRR